MTKSTLDQISNHLEFLGYEMSRNGEVTRARHARDGNIMLRPFGGGHLFVAMFRCSNGAKTDRLAFLEFVNSLNAASSASRFYVDKDFDFVIEAWYPDDYSRHAFALFVDNWNRDLRLLAQPEAIRYLQ